LSTAAGVTHKHIRTSTLDVAYEESGKPDGSPVFLLHGWPYDPRCYDAVLPPLIGAGCRVIVPYLRGFGATRFLSAGTPRSGQQAALGNDLRELMDALAIERAVLAGYDWGGRAACIVAALWPQRVRGLVTGNGYNIQDIAASARPQAPAQEHRFWYQYYFHTERGRAGLEQNRRVLCRYIWQIRSPNWKFDDVTYERSAASFDNPDFVAVTIQSYRHRFGYAPGDPELEAIEQRLAAQPNRCAGDRAAGRGRWRRAARNVGEARAFFYRPVPAPPAAEGRPQPAAGGAECRGGCDPRIDPQRPLISDLPLRRFQAL
jgi:pimeloyl-ACP methyl ester carboxylesterase